MIKHKATYSILVIILLLSCQGRQSVDCDLIAFNELKSKARTIEYQHVKISDNKFNSTFDQDTFDVTIFILDDDKMGFHIETREREWFYNSSELIELDHRAEARSVQSIDDIHDTPLVRKHILSLLDTLADKKCELISIDDISYQLFAKRIVSASFVDSSLNVTREIKYTLPRTGTAEILYEETVIRAGDTLLVQKQYLKNIDFQSGERYDLAEGRINSSSYETLKDDNALPFGKKPVSEGDMLARKEFVDIENNRIRIIGKNSGYALIIFSFIGCTPCEIALKELRANGCDKWGNVDLYYSSFQNDNRAIERYLEDKDVFKNAFGKESNMIEEFRLPVGPTFVLIDSKGEIVKIIEGFDKSVLRSLDEVTKAG